MAQSEDSRDQLAAQVVSQYAAWSAVAGFVPVPFADVAAIGALQLQMLRRIAQVYSVPFTDHLGKSVLASLLGSVVPVMAAPAAAGGILSLLKSFPTAGTTIASLSMPGLSAGSTYAIGKIFIQHFASGGTLLDFNPQHYREHLKSDADKRETTAPAPGSQAAAA
jgi:uncharacterized protein (DUF697 family)